MALDRLITGADPGSLGAGIRRDCGAGLSGHLCGKGNDEYADDDQYHGPSGRLSDEPCDKDQAYPNYSDDKEQFHDVSILYT